MNLDARIVTIVRQGPGAVSLRHLCLLLFPTFSWEEMALIAGFVRLRCQDLVQAGRLCEVTEDRFITVQRRAFQRLAHA